MEWNLFNALFGLGMRTKVQTLQETAAQAEPGETDVVIQSEDPDIRKISDYAGGVLKIGMVIEISLHEILELIPPVNPNRRRKDSYDGLTRKLRDLGVELRIDSRRCRQ